MPNSEIIPITIAGIVIEVTSPLSVAELGIEQRLGPFFGTEEKPLARVDLRWRESFEEPSFTGELVYDPGSVWKMYRDGDESCAVLSYHDEGETAQAKCVLRANSGWESIEITEQRSGELWQSLMNFGAGELIFRAAVLFTGGLVFHASGLEDNGKGIVFVGHSGAGKSTQLDMWNQEAGITAMNDDRIAVRVNEGGAMSYGLPWAGSSEIARNHAAPLSAIIVLEQAPENVIHRLSPSAAVSLLAARTFLPYWDKTLMRLAIANLNTILSNVPVYQLRCRPEPAAIALVRSVL